MSEEILINGKKITELSDMFFEYCELQNAIERLQEENKRLQMLSCANCGEKYLSPDGAELYEKNVQLQKENKQMQERLNNCEKFFNELGELLNEEVGNAYWTQAILHKIKKLIEINNELAEEHKTIGQDLYAEIKNYGKEKFKICFRGRRR